MFGNQSSFWESARALIMLSLTRKKGCSEIKVVEKKSPTGVLAVWVTVCGKNWERVGGGRMWVSGICAEFGVPAGHCWDPHLSYPDRILQGNHLFCTPNSTLLHCKFQKEQFPFLTLDVIADTMDGESCGARELLISCLQGSAAAKGSFHLLLSLSCLSMLLLLGVREGGVNRGCCVRPGWNTEISLGNVREEQNVPSCLIILNLPLIL